MSSDPSSSSMVSYAKAAAYDHDHFPASLAAPPSSSSYSSVVNSHTQDDPKIGTNPPSAGSPSGNGAVSLLPPISLISTPKEDPPNPQRPPHHTQFQTPPRAPRASLLLSPPDSPSPSPLTHLSSLSTPFRSSFASRSLSGLVKSVPPSTNSHQTKVVQSPLSRSEGNVKVSSSFGLGMMSPIHHTSYSNMHSPSGNSSKSKTKTVFDLHLQSLDLSHAPTSAQRPFLIQESPHTRGNLKFRYRIRTIFPSSSSSSSRFRSGGLGSSTGSTGGGGPAICVLMDGGKFELGIPIDGVLGMFVKSNLDATAAEGSDEVAANESTSGTGGGGGGGGGDSFLDFRDGDDREGDEETSGNGESPMIFTILFPNTLKLAWSRREVNRYVFLKWTDGPAMCRRASTSDPTSTRGGFSTLGGWKKVVSGGGGGTGIGIEEVGGTGLMKLTLQVHHSVSIELATQVGGVVLRGLESRFSSFSSSSGGGKVGFDRYRFCSFGEDGEEEWEREEDEMDVVVWVRKAHSVAGKKEQHEVMEVLQGLKKEWRKEWEEKESSKTDRHTDRLEVEGDGSESRNQDSIEDEEETEKFSLPATPITPSFSRKFSPSISSHEQNRYDLLTSPSASTQQSRFLRLNQTSSSNSNNSVLLTPPPSAKRPSSQHSFRDEDRDYAASGTASSSSASFRTSAENPTLTVTRRDGDFWIPPSPPISPPTSPMMASYSGDRGEGRRVRGNGSSRRFLRWGAGSESGPAGEDEKELGQEDDDEDEDEDGEEEEEDQILFRPPSISLSGSPRHNSDAQVQQSQPGPPQLQPSFESTFLPHLSDDIPSRPPTRREKTARELLFEELDLEPLPPYHMSMSLFERIELGVSLETIQFINGVVNAPGGTGGSGEDFGRETGGAGKGGFVGAVGDGRGQSRGDDRPRDGGWKSVLGERSGNALPFSTPGKRFLSGQDTRTKADNEGQSGRVPLYRRGGFRPSPPLTPLSPSTPSPWSPLTFPLTGHSQKEHIGQGSIFDHPGSVRPSPPRALSPIGPPGRSGSSGTSHLKVREDLGTCAPSSERSPSQNLIERAFPHFPFANLPTAEPQHRYATVHTTTTTHSSLTSAPALPNAEVAPLNPRLASLRESALENSSLRHRYISPNLAGGAYFNRVPGSPATSHRRVVNEHVSRPHNSVPIGIPTATIDSRQAVGGASGSGPAPSRATSVFPTSSWDYLQL